MCERWMSPKRLRNIDDDVSGITTVYQFLDHLIDAHLWHLPIPRFDAPFEPRPVVLVEPPKVNFINVLRDTEVSEDIHAYVTVLMILDLKSLQDIPIQVAYQPNFVDCARDCISEDFSIVSSSTLDFLRQFNAFIIKKSITMHFKPKNDSYLRFADIDAALVSDAYLDEHKKFIQDSEAPFSKKLLEDHCYVRNLVDENPEYTFFY